MLENLWNDAEAAKHAGYDELLYRAHILGQDPSVTNWKGGNISGKYVEKGFDGQPIGVLRVKGSGSDLRTAAREDFVGVAHEPVMRLYERREMADEEMVAYLNKNAVSEKERSPTASRLPLSPATPPVLPAGTRGGRLRAKPLLNSPFLPLLILPL